MISYEIIPQKKGGIDMPKPESHGCQITRVVKPKKKKTIEELLAELIQASNKIASVLPFDSETENLSETTYWENQAHTMQVAVSDTHRLVLPLVRELSDRLSELEEREKYMFELEDYKESRIKENRNRTIPLDEREEYLNIMILCQTEIERLEKQVYDLQSRNAKISQKPTLNKFTSDNQPRNRKPRKGTLTDKQIKTILRIADKRGKYKNMSLRSALEEIQLQSKTYYKVIRLEYRSEATKGRIRRIANQLGVKLPSTPKTS